MISLNDLLKNPLKVKEEKEKNRPNNRRPHLESSCGGSKFPGVGPYTVKWCGY